MTKFKAKFLTSIMAVAGAMAIAAPAAHATVAANGWIVGTFTDPVLNGNVINYPAVGQGTLFGNSATAAVSGVGTNQLIWGTNPDGVPQTGDNSSSLTFGGFGAPILGPTGTNEVVGVLGFANGTSALDSLIFGATLNFYWTTTGTDMTFLGSDSVTITTTSNQFLTGPFTLDEEATDADYINICGNSSNICSTSIQSYESTEVGASYIPFLVTLSATYDSDPGITVTGVDYASEDTKNDGTLGAEAPLGEVPEPMSLSLFGAGLAGAVAFGRCRKKA
ncbi:MAG TPA: choice-of-anchor K domain-containing protein [Rhizomicrobium sp.]|nr:choice-of-anchor K domain-containing protein [Rhizomicrobium sp.]